MIPKLTEFDSYITPDGLEFRLHAPPKRVVLSEEGAGMPPIEYITQRGPFQHGESLIDYFLRPRTVQLVIRHMFCSREQLWDGRGALLDYLRPNRTVLPTPGQLRKYLPDGSRRDIDVYIQDGPGYAPRQGGVWEEWSFQEVLRFNAYNPVYYNPVQRTQEFTSEDVSNLSFPITFPVTFSSFGRATDVTYFGNWVEYPEIRITGPLTGASIINNTTDERIEFNTAIIAGQTVVISLSYGLKTVESTDDVNLIGYITPRSDLATFHLAPDPQAAGGINNIEVYGTGSNVNTAISIRWHDRFVGLSTLVQV